MSLKSSVFQRRAAVLVLFAILAGTLAPTLFSSGDKTGDTLRPELALVPQDAFAFVHLRAGEVWDNDMIAKLRKHTGKEFDPLKQSIGVDLVDVESMTYVFPTV